MSGTTYFWSQIRERVYAQRGTYLWTFMVYTLSLILTHTHPSPKIIEPINTMQDEDQPGLIAWKEQDGGWQTGVSYQDPPAINSATELYM